MPHIDVKTTTRRYGIHVEPGLLGRLGELVRAVAPHGSAMLAVDTKVLEDYGKPARQSLEQAGYEMRLHELVAEERSKTLDVVMQMYEAMLAARLERRSPLIALGGGVVGDTAGLVAATYLRGVPLVQVPTTLLAMVDASIGGKTGVNFPLPVTAGGTAEIGKNLIGSFWQPHVVIADPETLRTLDPRQLRCGIAECIKHGVIADQDLLGFIEREADRIIGLDMDVLTQLIVRSAAVKVAIVEEDEREIGRRALLNLGHTFGHVIEPIEELQLHHGEAVAVGMVAASHCAVARGMMDGEDAQRLATLLERIGLPTVLTQPVGSQRLIDAMGYDKKVASGRVRLILPTGLGAARVVDDVDPATIRDAWLAVGAD
jgi:3-dehydroquinate synthase